MISPSRDETKISAPAAMLIVHGSTIARDVDGRADVVAVGQRGERDVGAGDRRR